MSTNGQPPARSGCKRDKDGFATKRMSKLVREVSKILEAAPRIYR